MQSLTWKRRFEERKKKFVAQDVEGMPTFASTTIVKLAKGAKSTKSAHLYRVELGATLGGAAR